MQTRSPPPALNVDTLDLCFQHVGYDDMWRMTTVNVHMRKVALPMAVARVAITVNDVERLRSLHLCLIGGYAQASNVRELSITPREGNGAWISSVAEELVALLDGMTGLRTLHIARLENLLDVDPSLAQAVHCVPRLRKLRVDEAGPNICALIRRQVSLYEVTFRAHSTPHVLTFHGPDNMWRPASLRTLRVQDFLEDSFRDCAFPALRSLTIGSDHENKTSPDTVMYVEGWSRACPALRHLAIGAATSLRVDVRPSACFAGLTSLDASSVHMITLGFTHHISAVRVICHRPMGGGRVAEVFESIAAVKPRSIVLRGDLGSYHRFFHALRTVSTARVCVIDANMPDNYNRTWSWIDDFYVRENPLNVRLRNADTLCLDRDPGAVVVKQRPSVSRVDDTEQGGPPGARCRWIETCGAWLADARPAVLRSQIEQHHMRRRHLHVLGRAKRSHGGCLPFRCARSNGSGGIGAA